MYHVQPEKLSGHEAYQVIADQFFYQTSKFEQQVAGQYLQSNKKIII